MILLYHLIFPDDTPRDAWNAGKILRLKDLKRQIYWLGKYYRFVPLSQYVNERLTNPNSKTRSTAITFDDGYQATYDVVAPFFEAEALPATIFACTNHLDKPQLLWFVYFNALCFERVFTHIMINEVEFPLDSEQNCLKAWHTLIMLARSSGDAISFSHDFAIHYPLPEEIINKYHGLRLEQIKDIGKSQVLRVGCHTHNHPYLDQLTGTQQLNEMLHNKCILEELTGKPVDSFAYTGGIYNNDSLKAVQIAKFSSAFAVKPQNLGTEKVYEFPRIDIYSSSLIKFIFKILSFDYLRYH